MALTEDRVKSYLINAPSLKVINNHEVRDLKGDKTGQMPLAIKIGKQWIDDLLKKESKQDKKRVTKHEKESLFALREALDSLPSSLNIQSLWSTVTGLDSIQKKVLDSVNVYLSSITQFEAHELFLKALVLVLKILEYDLSKKPGPITLGYGFFKLQILSEKQRIENHAQVRKLVTEVIERFDSHYKPLPTHVTPSTAVSPCSDTYSF